MTDQPPRVHIEGTRRALWDRFSIVWIIPLLALAIAVGVAWQSYASRGALIEIVFENGAGVKSGETEVRHRDVTVGLVESVKFANDLTSVIVGVRLDQDIAPFVDNSSQFWVVRPQVTTQGITGLDTVLSGVFIEGSWDSVPGGVADRFEGLNEVPLIRPGEAGLQIALRSGARASLTDNAPILYRGIEVGRVGRAQIARNGGFAIAEALIYEKYAHLVTENTRFWDVSGFNFKVSAAGAEVDFKSLASLLSGGITFETIISGGAPLQDGRVFQVYGSEDTARNSVFNASDVEALELTVFFAENIAGLALGAPVELKGLKIGEVTNLNGVVDRTVFGDARVRLNTTISIQPARLGLSEEATPENALEFLREQVDRGGLRARLASASILTGGLKVELAEVENAPQASILPGNPFPILPVTASDVVDAGATAEGVLSRIQALPVEELMVSAIDVLNSANALISDDALRETPQDVRDLIGDVRGLVGAPQTQEIPTQVAETLARLNTAIGTFDGVLAQIETENSIGRLNAALDAAAAAASGVDTAIAGVPALVERIEGVAAKAEALDLESLIASANGVIGAAETLIASDTTAELPASLSAALDEMRLALIELREGGAVRNANAALASASRAADAVATATQDFPSVIDRLNRLLAQAGSTLQSYDGSSDVNREARAALRDIQQAADAIAALARTIQRNPNSLLLGR